MGYGDDLMITAFAAEEKKRHPNKQVIIGSLELKQAFHSIVYDNNPNITDCRKLDNSQNVHFIDYHTRNRPYIDYKKSIKGKYVWNTNSKPLPGELYFTQNELDQAENILNEAKENWNQNNKKKYKGSIFLETSSTKINDSHWSVKHINKSWGEKNWKNLIKAINKSYLIIHSTHENSNKFPGVYSPQNVDFRLGCAIMSKCDAYVGPEGGFGHVAGALKKKGVVYFGGWITPEAVGYDFHNNLYFKHPESPCGLYLDLCKHCELARSKISVETFKKNIEKIFK